MTKDKKYYKTKKSFLKDYIKGSFQHAEEILKISQKGDDFFIAVKCYRGELKKLTEVVTVFHLKIKEKNNKFIPGLMKPENTGIPVDKCPKTILELLTESESRTARDWRARCWTHYGVFI